jgi:predicted lipoprotein with Yx(FWY)xxD motif
MNRIRAIAGVIVAAGIVVVVLSVTGGSGNKGTSAGAATRVPAASTSLYGTTTGSKAGAARAGTVVATRASSLGRLLTDGQGRTLYLFEGDKPDVSKLSRTGLGVWPPLAAAGKPQVTRGALAAKIGAITGVNGKPQVTYNRHPLYYYVGDTNAGQTRGQGLNQFGAEWYVLAPSGRKIDNG